MVELKINHDQQQRARNLISGNVTAVGSQKQVKKTINADTSKDENFCILPIIILSGGKTVYSIHSPDKLKLK